MPRRELRTFEYACDGCTRGGQPCPGRKVLTTSNAGEADELITTAQVHDRWTELPLGWLCPRQHEDFDEKRREDAQRIHDRDDLMLRIRRSDPDNPILDAQGVEFGPHCVTLNSCATANLCNGTCKLY
jgi:hypothetical protein